MLPRSPKIDLRSNAERIDETIALMERYSQWRRSNKADPGLAMIRMFNHVLGLVSDRLNQAPDKHFLAFLDLIGGQLLPPQPARVPLTFSLATGSQVDAFVPALTEIAAPPSGEEKEEVLFETEEDLVVTPAQLQAVYLNDPTQRCWYSLTDIATGKMEGSFPIFSPDRELNAQLIDQFLYLACPDVLTEALTAMTVSFEGTELATLRSLFAEWTYWTGTEWAAIRADVSNTTVLTIRFANLSEMIARLRSSNDRMITPPNLAAVRRSTTEQKNEVWLRVRLNQINELPTIRTIRLNRTIDSANRSVSPQTALFNNTEIQLNQDFYPLGERPKFNDTFYIASDVFASPGTITLRMTGSTGARPQPQSLSIDWDVWTSEGWSTLSPATTTPASLFNIGSNKTETISFTLTNKTAKTTINNIENYWIRARITAGNFGEAAKTIVENPSNQDPVYKLIPESFNPPVLRSLTIQYAPPQPASQSPAACLTFDGVNYQERTQNFQPYKLRRDRHPTLYLGFDRPFSNRPIALYFQVESPHPTDVNYSNSVMDRSTPPQIVWEYSSDAEWSRLGVQDETQTFCDRGLVRFIAPVDMQPREEFGKTQYWLRVRWEAGEFRIKPRLQRILTNTTWASQSVTLINEVLGSSNGNPNQIFRTSQFPVLIGQQLAVQEPNLSLYEQEQWMQQYGNDAVTVINNAVEQRQGAWVIWQEVPDFNGSGSDDRHYILDRDQGIVRFGDGQFGRVPPQESRNIRLSVYRTGGGKRGNCAANTIAQLKTTIPMIDRVTNLEAAGGGADRESMERFKERAPKLLRHQNRAVAIEDFEDLAYAASPSIARSRLIVPQFNPRLDALMINPTEQNSDPRNKLSIHPTEAELTAHEAAKQNEVEAVTGVGQLTLLIVPNSPAAQPTPSLTLLDQVEAFLLERCLPTLSLRVAAPDWIRVSVTAELVPVSIEVADRVRSEAVQHIQDFLHPLTGQHGAGWEFGHQPRPSEFYGLLNRIVGVNYVRSLSVELANDKRIISPNDVSPASLIYSGTHTIKLALSEEAQ
ncbi:putative baseplate assembly protein [Pseudanabaenaceae cyanobacterium LEGE 13415]|nr:putative baseplate assembly protein [Pseudanabaenaceae cyanobacterium LEGE 13415]